MSSSRMFILLGMLAVAASDLLLLLERRNSGGFHEVYALDGGFCVLDAYITLPLLISLPCCKSI